MSEEQQQLATPHPKIKWSKKKIGLLILAFVFLAGALLFHIVAGKVRHAAEQTLLAKVNEAVNGQVVVGGIDLSILGYVEVKEVQVLDAAARPLAKINRVHISYNWSDLIKGQLGPQIIKDITLEKPEFWIIYNQDRLNWDGLLKPKTTDQPVFSGLIKIEDGKLHLKTETIDKTADQLTGKLEVQQDSKVGISATGKFDQAALTIDGQWGGQGASEITLSTKGMDLAKLELTAANDPIQLTGGKLDELAIIIGKDTSDTLLLKSLAGRFSNVNTAGVLVLTQGSAQFEKQGDTIQFTNGQALYKGQTVTAAGKVLTAPSGEKTLDFDIQMPAGNPAALLPSLQTGGVLVAHGKATGSVFSPVFNGNFTLDSIQFGNIIVNNINGSFLYTQQLLKLLTAKGTTSGGSVAASGDINPDTQQYTLAISGSDLDTSKLTEKDVKGPLSFTGTATGSTAAAVAQGNFTVYNGTAYGISFRTLTGNFIKRGSAEAQVSNLALKTDFGVFYPEQLNQSVLQELHDRKLPITREGLQEQLTQKATEKLLDKLFNKP